MPERIIITGGPGFGKTSVINALEKMGYPVFQEVSREIIDEQKAIDGPYLPWKDHDGFHRLVFEGRFRQWKDASAIEGPVFFDRGMPDSLAYLVKDGLIPDPAEEKLVHAHRYYPKIFIVPPWQEIYLLDAQRWEDFEHATRIHEALMEYYTQAGYEIVLLPKVTIAERVDIVLSNV